MDLPSRKSSLPNIKTIITTIGSVATTAMLVRSLAKEYLPSEFQNYINIGIRNFFNKFSTYMTMAICESDEYEVNEVYEAAELYVTSGLMNNDIHRLEVSKKPKQKTMVVSMETNSCEVITDVYKGVKFYWSKSVYKTLKTYDLGRLELTFHKDHKDLALNDYLPFILDEAEKRKEKERTLKLFTVKSYWNVRPWKPVNFDHPSNFATLAMDVDVKEKVMKDLDRFVERREYYRTVGKAWKRGYLLYGPPGTGKSSLIGAMANYLNFDIYDLDLTSISSNAELRRLLLATQNRSILVVEDIDCSAELHDRVAVDAAKAKSQKNQNTKPEEQDKEKHRRITLSGFLNIIDGLWSSCGDERIIVFTTNHRNKLDPALLRPGRMDMHIHMSYCTPCGFRLLVSNYLGITEHSLFSQIEDLILKINITPAEVAEQLLKNDDPDIILDGLINFLEAKRNKNEEGKATVKKEGKK